MDCRKRKGYQLILTSLLEDPSTGGPSRQRSDLAVVVKTVLGSHVGW